MERRAQGAGPSVVLVHALGGTMASWDAHVAHLQAAHTVVTVALPGHDGLSVPRLIDSAVGPVVDYDQVARDLAETIREAGAAPAVVIGHSLGGTIAARVPLVDPGAARAVVIVDSMIARMPVPEEQRQALADALAKDREGALRGFYGRISRPGQLDRIVADALKVPPAAWLGYLAGGIVQSIPDGGRALSVPILLQASSVFIPDGANPAERLSQGGFQHVPSLTVDRFPEALHWIHWEDEAGWRASIDRFLAQVP